MGALAALLNAQRRPDHEAERLTAAFTDALADTSNESGGAAELADAIMSAYRQTNQQIADEKLPPPPEKSAEYTRAFGQEDEPSQFTDDEESLPSRDESNYLVDAGEDETGDVLAAPDLDVEVPVESALADDPTEVSASPPVDSAAGTGNQTEPAEEEVAAPEEDNGHEYADEPGEGDDPESEDDAERANGEADPTPIEYATLTGASAAHIPSSIDAYSSAPDPWGDQEELEPETVEDAAGHQQPDIDGTGNDANRSAPTPLPEVVTPSPTATAPPDDIDDPDAVPEAGPKERAIDRFAIAVQWVRDHRKQVTTYAAVFAAVVIVVGGLFTSVRSHRGGPPLPANTIAPQPPEIDNADRAPQDKTLIPEMVSASCGNDSDAVAPFSGNKKRAWLCVRINGLDLNVLNITFAQPVVVTKICVVPGWNYVAPDGRDEWNRHRLTTGTTWRMGGAVYPQKITPTRTGVCKEFPSVITVQMSMTITATERPPVGEGAKHGGDISNREDDESKVDADTAIGTITIIGHPVNPESG
jgi:hypothetical protein